MSILEVVPLLPLQKTILFRILSKPGFPLFAEQWRYKITGRLNIVLMEQAWKKTINSFEILHGSFLWKNVKEPIFIIQKEVENPCRIFSLENTPVKYKRKKASLIAWEEYQNPVDLEVLPIRMAVTILSAEHYELIVTSNHILFDGWSNAIIMNQLMQNYCALQKNYKMASEKRPIYSDYIRSVYQEQNDPRHTGFWEGYLQGIRPLTAHPRRNKLGNCRAHIPVKEETVQQIQKFCQSNNCTVSVILYTVWTLLLYIEKPCKTVITGATVSGRSTLPASQLGLAGLLAKTLPLRVNFNKEQSVKNIMKDICYDLIAIEEHMHVNPIVWQKILPDIDTYFREGLTIQNYPVQRHGSQNKCDWSIEFYHSFYHSDMDFSISVKTYIAPFTLEISYAPEQYSEASVYKRLNLFLHILNQLVHSDSCELQLHFAGWIKTHIRQHTDQYIE